jgi:hypothetical protein
VKFTLEEYFPAVHKRPTRVGKVTDLVLLQPKDRTTRYEFFCHVGWSGLAMGGDRLDYKTVARKLESFKARIKRLGFYSRSCWLARA